MPFNVNAFKTRGLFYGGARPSLFDIQLSVPQGIGIDNLTVQNFSFVARATELPASEVASFDVPYFGRKIKLAGDRTFADWRVTVMNDEDFAVRAMFEKWSNAINRMVANVRDPGLDNEVVGYKTDVLIQQWSKDGFLIRSYVLVGAFPTTIDAISVDWNSTNAVEEYAVTFAYDYWVPGQQSSIKKHSGVNVYDPGVGQFVG